MAGPADESPGEWLSISALARLRGVRKSAISKRVTRLEQLGLINSRPGALNSKEINVAEFLRAVEISGDAIREANGVAAGSVHRLSAANGGRRSPARSVVPSDMDDGPGDPILAREQAKRAAADAELKRMDLEERRGRMISADQAERFVDLCSANAQTVLWRLPGLVEDIVAIATKEGVPAARTFVKGHVREAIAEVGALMRMVADPLVKPGEGGAPPLEGPDADI
jgi:DNA-binding MarR family transcriptional regulator